MKLRTLAFLACLAVSVSARADVVAEWQKKIADSTKALESGEYKRSLGLAESVVRQMIERLGLGEASTKAFGVAVMHKAVALAGLGKHDDAIWYWQVASSLHPELAKRDLSAFGEAGKFLAENGEPRKPPVAEAGDGKPRTAELTPPKLLKHTLPTFPGGAHAMGAGGQLVVEVVITETGTVTSPVIEQPLSAPTLSYVALEAVRRWRFQPAKNQGEPVPVIFKLTVGFKP
ncbi:MAG TPA: TonB family protein [Thermoanaerobaculia bacterium]|jgi:TonB family protein